MNVVREIICVGDNLYLECFELANSTVSYKFTTDKRKAMKLTKPDLTESIQLKIRAIYPGKRVYREIVNERIS